ncbi:Dam family site-specific DNA-(adenine-N6)-methyltransferase [Halosegnis rubeus]|jgi:DNA adenine methylase|uniref:site-specific DNA-methyltransferase (adenine-specific) n=1 Tax=Halosegnis rubeus TaxID=2212850 RepID=A0A5N5UEN4_9EURY|nr:DNA adenine methylase [Halosegnis rubeus]KAB7516191.1 Dam family site-specific DNA-(adenine-N6)-methyltransferase [Halosegnis rubeus]
MTSSTNFKPVIKWTGSKRTISDEIVSTFPEEYDMYYEPFLGSGSILYQLSPSEAICGDICEPLIGIWKLIRDDPEELITYYRREWKRLQDEGPDVYYEIREKFNETKNPKHLFFLSRTCVNGLIRFNSDGEFNNSFHLSRPGINPKRMGPIITEWSRDIQDVEFVSGEYNVTTSDVSQGDFVYLDPPYFNTTSRYYGSIDYDRFLDFLKDLNDRDVKYALSYDGHSGDTDYTVDLPEWAYEEHLMLSSGNSSFKNVMDQEVAEVKESLYLNYERPEQTEEQSRLQSF